MPDLKISGMTAAAVANDADILPIVQGGANFKSTVALIRAGLIPVPGGTPATGDTVYLNGSTWTRLAIGTSGKVLRSTGTAPAWDDDIFVATVTSTATMNAALATYEASSYNFASISYSGTINIDTARTISKQIEFVEAPVSGLTKPSLNWQNGIQWTVSATLSFYGGLLTSVNATTPCILVTTDASAEINFLGTQFSLTNNRFVEKANDGRLSVNLISCIGSFADSATLGAFTLNCAAGETDLVELFITAENCTFTNTFLSAGDSGFVEVHFSNSTLTAGVNGTWLRNTTGPTVTVYYDQFSQMISQSLCAGSSPITFTSHSPYTFSTTVGSPGSDTVINSEKAIRTALTAATNAATTFTAIATSSAELMTALTTFTAGSYAAGIIQVQGALVITAGSQFTIAKDLRFLGKPIAGSTTKPSIQINNGCAFNVDGARISFCDLDIVTSFSSSYLVSTSTTSNKTAEAYFLNVNHTGNTGRLAAIPATGGALYVQCEGCTFTNTTATYGLFFSTSNPASNNLNLLHISMRGCTMTGAIVTQAGRGTVTVNAINTTIADGGAGCWSRDATNGAMTVTHSKLGATISHSLISGSGTVTFLTNDDYRIFADLAAVKAVSDFVNGERIYVTSLDTRYRYDSATTQYANDYSCIKPTSVTTGRLIAISGTYAPKFGGKWVFADMTSIKSIPTAELTLGDVVEVRIAGDDNWRFQAVTETIASDLIERIVDANEAYVIIPTDEVGSKRLILTGAYDSSRSIRWIGSFVATVAATASSIYGWQISATADTSGRFTAVCVHPYNSASVRTGPVMYHSVASGAIFSCDFATVLNQNTNTNAVMQYGRRWSTPIPLQFSYTDVTASLTSQDMYLVGGNTKARPVARGGEIVSIVARVSAARTAGTISLKLTINGVATSDTYLDLTIDSGNPNQNYKAITYGSSARTTFSAGDRIGMQLTTSADWAPVTADLDVFLEIAYT